MEQAKDILQQKIHNRRLSIEWTNRKASAPVATPPDPAAEALNRLNQALHNAWSSQIVTPYTLITSGRRLIGPVIVFVKRAIRKIIHVCLGWYIFPMLSRQSELNGNLVNALVQERDLLCALQDRCSESARRIDEQTAQLAGYADANARASALLGKLQAQSDESARCVKKQAAQLAHLAEESARAADALGALQEQSSASVSWIKGQAAQLAHLAEENARTADALGALQEQSSASVSWIKGQAAQLAHLAEENARTADALGTLQAQSSEATRRIDEHAARLDRLTYVSHLDDSFYHDFEEKYRGSFEEICNRESAYIPMVMEQVKDVANARFVDIGSGRGEWLELLRANGATNYIGVDLNETQNELARSRGHQAVHMDGIAYLQSLPEESVDVITAFQLVEHLTMDQLMVLIRECLRVLKKGGMILFETNNPTNLTVGADTFYLDPTHYRPLDSRLMSFLVEHTGFAQVRVMDCHAHPLSNSLTAQDEDTYGAELYTRVNALSWAVFGPQDYAVVAVKE